MRDNKRWAVRWLMDSACDALATDTQRNTQRQRRINEELAHGNDTVCVVVSYDTTVSTRFALARVLTRIQTQAGCTVSYELSHWPTTRATSHGGALGLTNEARRHETRPPPKPLHPRTTSG